MEQNIEEKILQRIIEQKIIDNNQLRQIEKELKEDTPTLSAGTWGARITLLIEKGMLDTKTVEKIKTAIEQELNEVQCPACKNYNLPSSKTCTTCGADLQEFAEAISTVLTPPKQPISSIQLRPGTDFGSRYYIIEEIGRGGMGRVYKAKDKEVNQLVALKIIRPELSSDSAVVERFKRELLLAREITHENVIRIHDIGDIDGIKYITMPFIEGTSLHDLLHTTGRLSIEQAILIAKQILNALNAAHKKGIIHRDLKPQNIMLDKHGHVYVMDFGIAKSIETRDASKDGFLVGTPEYMSPEQAKGLPSDQRSDIYSFGIIMYEMLTGEPPFKSETVSGYIHQHISVAPQPPSKINQGIEPALESIILKTIEKEPQLRAQNAQELINDLELMQSGVVPAGSKRSAKWHLPAIAIAGLLIIIIVITVYLWKSAAPIPDTGTTGTQITQQQPPLPKQTAEWKNSIAVLPFKNLSQDTEQDYFCEGMTEQIITNLTHIKELKVIAKTTVMKYKEAQKDIRQIGEELNVAHVLEGSVQKSGSRIRIVANLIQVDNQTQLWSERYDHELKDVFEVQDNVSKAIVDELHMTLTTEISASIKTSKPKSVEAYEYYLKAKYYHDTHYLASYNEEEFQQAIKLAKEAISLDPNYALAYALIVSFYNSHFIHSENPDDITEMLKYADEAYKINPDLPETLRAKHLAHFNNDEDDKAYLYIKKALELNPNDFDNNNVAQMFSGRVYLFYEAFEFQNRCLEVNPLAFSIYYDRGFMLTMLGQLDKAKDAFEKCLELKSDDIECMVSYSEVLIYKREYDRAYKLLQHVDEIKAKDDPALDGFINNFWALYYASTGNKEKALSLKNTYRIYAMLGMKNESFTKMQEALHERNLKMELRLSYLGLTHIQLFDSIRNDPRFQEIVKLRKKVYDENLKKYTLL